VLIGLFKDSKVVKEITYASKGSAEWVKKKLGKDYIEKIVEKYVVKDGGLRKGEEFDEIVNSLKNIYRIVKETKIEEDTAREFSKVAILDRWDLRKLNEILTEALTMPNGKYVVKKAVEDTASAYNFGHLYELEIAYRMKREGMKNETMRSRLSK